LETESIFSAKNNIAYHGQKNDVNSALCLVSFRVKDTLCQTPK